MEQLNLFRDNLPRKPYCSDDLSAGLKIRTLDYAAAMRYIQQNHVNSKLWLVYDVDRPTSPEEIYEDIGLAPPNLFIQNPKNGNAHVAYSLNNPVHLNQNSSQKPIRFAGALDAAYREKMDADRGYAGLIMKNPLNESWRTFSIVQQSYDLPELAEYVDLSKFNDKRVKTEAYGLGRNCQLFDSLRHWAYRNKDRYRDYDAWFDAVAERAEMYNAEFLAPLEWREVKHTVKSVANWVWKYYDGSGKVKRGRDALKGSLLDLHDKQVLSAIETHNQRKLSTRERIAVVVTNLQSNGRKVTQKMVAETSGLSLRTVKYHWHTVK